MTQTIDQILALKPEARPRIYAYAIDDTAHAGLLKVGQTTRDVKQRVAEQLKTAAIKNYRIEIDVPAERDDGTIFRDHEVREALKKKGFENTELEWMRCSVEDVKTVLAELRTGQRITDRHHQTFPMRREQAEAVNKHTPTSIPSGRRICTPFRASCGMRRCASARPSQRINSPSDSAQSACWW
jgi:hypothetical protein